MQEVVGRSSPLVNPYRQLLAANVRRLDTTQDRNDIDWCGANTAGNEAHAVVQRGVYPLGVGTLHLYRRTVLGAGVTQSKG